MWQSGLSSCGPGVRRCKLTGSSARALLASRMATERAGFLHHGFHGVVPDLLITEGRGKSVLWMIETTKLARFPNPSLFRVIRSHSEFRAIRDGSGSVTAVPRPP